MKQYRQAEVELEDKIYEELARSSRRFQQYGLPDPSSITRQQTDGLTLGPSQIPRLHRFAHGNIALIGGEEVEEDNNSEDGSPAPKKRKLAALTQGQSGGRVAKGKDFGARWTFFFAEKMKPFGSKNLLSSGWKDICDSRSPPYLPHSSLLSLNHHVSPHAQYFFISLVTITRDRHRTVYGYSPHDYGP
ncbi:hypothetical protein B0H14DRAFT_2645195 [Mycena olivaceomarginata]|nr:hypothetical protein B0H14DRAFT_2645195 [Mycena olivaceomarginata]